MRINPLVSTIVSVVFTPVAMAFLQETIVIMIPWLMVMFAVIICDLVSGIRKSLKLKVPVSFTTACRATFGKMVTYFAFVLMVAMLDVASGGGYGIAKWACLAVSALEVGSVFSNILKPYGITLSLRGLLKIILAKATDSSVEDMDDIVKRDIKRKARIEENNRWNRDKSRHRI